MMIKKPLILAMFSLAISFALSVGAVAQEAAPAKTKARGQGQASTPRKKKDDKKPGLQQAKLQGQRQKGATLKHVDAPKEGPSEAVKERFVEDQKEKDKK